MKLTEIMDIENIIRNNHFHARTRIDPKTVSRYATALKQGVVFPLVKIAVIDESPVLIDGYHRVEALRRAGKHTVEAELVEVDADEAKWLAFQANAAHGKPLKSKEYREGFRRYVRARHHRKGKGRYRSYREIASALGGSVHHTTIRNWMKRDFPKISARMGGDEHGNDNAGPRRIDPQEAYAEAARHHLEQANATSKAIADPEARGEIIRQAKALIEDLTTHGDFIEDDDPF